MRGDLYSGWATLGGQFPPSLNTDTDDSQLKAFESPSCYGVDCTSTGYLKTGSILTGTARTATTYTASGLTYYWYYNRLWRSNSSVLSFGAPEYQEFYYPQNCPIGVDATIVTFMPCLSNAMWICTASGSNFIRNATDQGGNFQLDQFVQELWASASANTLTLNGQPFVCNTNGLFSWDGNSVKEWTRPVRSSLGNFSNKAITAQYDKGFIIGASYFVVDTQTGKLFDYGTNGFMFTSRTLAQPQLFNPFQICKMAFTYQVTNGDNAYISWESKSNECDWFQEPDITIENGAVGKDNRAEFALNNPITNTGKFAMRITSLSTNIKIREIQINVAGLSTMAITE